VSIGIVYCLAAIDNQQYSCLALMFVHHQCLLPFLSTWFALLRTLVEFRCLLCWCCLRLWACTCDMVAFHVWLQVVLNLNIPRSRYWRQGECFPNSQNGYGNSSAGHGSPHSESDRGPYTVFASGSEGFWHLPEQIAEPLELTVFDWHVLYYHVLCEHRSLFFDWG